MLHEAATWLWLLAEIHASRANSQWLYRLCSKVCCCNRKDGTQQCGSMRGQYMRGSVQGLEASLLH
jgi:hypothetical protein